MPSGKASEIQEAFAAGPGPEQMRRRPHEEPEPRPVGEAEPERGQHERAVREGGARRAYRTRRPAHGCRRRDAGRDPAAPGPPSGGKPEVLGAIAGEAPDHRRAEEQQEHGKPEHPAPRQPGDDQRRRRVGDDRGETGGAVEQAIRPAALARRPPRRDEPACRREAHRLRTAVQGPRNRERPEAAREARPPSSARKRQRRRGPSGGARRPGPRSGRSRPETAPWTMRPAPLIQPISVALSPSSARTPGIAQPRFCRPV